MMQFLIPSLILASLSGFMNLLSMGKSKVLTRSILYVNRDKKFMNCQPLYAYFVNIQIFFIEKLKLRTCHLNTNSDEI